MSYAGALLPPGPQRSPEELLSRVHHHGRPSSILWGESSKTSSRQVRCTHDQLWSLPLLPSVQLLTAVLQGVEGRTACVRHVCCASATATRPAPRQRERAPEGVDYDAIVIGAGMGGLTTATQMAAKGAKVLVLEK